jgi:hypothetical protein
MKLSEILKESLLEAHKGGLYLGYSKTKSLPDNLEVEGDLDLENTPITSLPNNLSVQGYLNIKGCKNITSLPDSLKVGKDLNLGGTSISLLPDNLKVNGYLNLESTPIRKLPNNLEVRGGLNLIATGITSLPDSLKVGGELYLTDTPLGKKYTEEEILKMFPYVKSVTIMSEVVNEGMDHEVSMAQNSLKSIMQSCADLMNKLGNNERNIPGWIQNHISNAENFIDQAAQGFHELDGHGEEDDDEEMIHPVDEKKLTKAERAKKEDIIKSMAMRGGGKDKMGPKQYAIATAQAKKSAE